MKALIRNRFLAGLALAFASSTLAVPADNVTVLLGPVADTRVFDADWGRNSNDGGGGDIGVYQARDRSLLRFDLGQLPAGSTLSSANLHLTVTNTYGGNPNSESMNVHRLTQAWTEGGVTWNRYDGSNLWAAGGGDYDATVRASSTANAGIGQAVTWDVTTLAQEWAAGTHANHGLIVINSGNTNGLHFASKESGNQGYRPILAASITTPSAPPVGSWTWNGGDGTTGPVDGSGTWTDAGKWWNGSAVATWADGNDAIFGAGGTAGTVTISGTVAPGSLWFQSTGSGNYTLSGGAISFGGGSRIVQTDVNASIVSSLTNGGLIKQGSGTLSLPSTGMSGSPVNTLTGGTIISGGTLEIYGRSADNGGYTSIGTGPVTIHGGATFVSANDWATGNEWNGGNVGKITIHAGGTWTINAAGSTVRNGLALNGGSINGSGNNGDWGGMYLRNTSVTAAGNATSSISVDTALNAMTPMRVETGSTLNFSGTIHNRIVSTGGITKAGGGTLTLSGSNSYSGVTDVTGGTLVAAGNTAVGAGGWSSSTWTLVKNGATFALQGGISLDEHMHVTGAGVGGLGAIRSISGNNSLTMTNGNSGSGPGYAIDGDTTIGVDADSLNITGFYQEGGSYGITKVGAGTLVLSKTSSYSGGTTVSEGILSLGDGSTPVGLNDSAPVVIASGAKIDLNFTGQDYIGSLTLNGVDAGTGTFNATTHPAYFTGSGSLYVVPPNDGVWTASTNGNWEVPSHWQSGTVASGEDRSAIFNGATGTIATIVANRTIGSLNFSALDYTINGSATLTLANTTGISAIQVAAGTTATIGTAVAGSVALDKLGTGTLALTNSIQYTGGTTVTAGTLALPNGDWVTGNPWGPGGASGAITVGSGATLSTSAGVTEIKNGIVLNGGTISSRGLTYPGAWGNLFLSSNIVADGSAVSTISSQITLTGNRYFAVESGSTLNLSGQVSSWNHPGTGITKTGLGTLALSAANSYNGSTNVWEGTLVLGNGTDSSNLADTADVTVDAGAVLQLNFPSGSPDTIDELTLGGVAMPPGTYNSGNSGGFITGTGSIIVQNGPPSDPLLAWIDATWPSLSDKTATGDPDNDGIENLLEYVLQGGDPSVSGTGILPTIDASGANFIFTYYRRTAATGTTQAFEYGTDLSGWTPVAIPGGAGVTVTDQGGGIEKVEISVAKGSNSQLYGRLQVTK